MLPPVVSTEPNFVQGLGSLALSGNRPFSSCNNFLQFFYHYHCIWLIKYCYLKCYFIFLIVIDVKFLLSFELNATISKWQKIIFLLMYPKYIQFSRTMKQYLKKSMFYYGPLKALIWILMNSLERNWIEIFRNIIKVLRRTLKPLLNLIR